MSSSALPNAQVATIAKEAASFRAKLPGRSLRSAYLRLGLKRSLDLVIAAIGLAVLSPLLGLIAIAVRLDSCGPSLYHSLRVGKSGNRFRCHKFRTMATGADQEKSHLRLANERNGPFFKIAADPRVTRLGRWLRRYSLDELPQLWNVMCGEMSLVGPRPHPLDDVELYEPQYLRRLDVTPGITGLWQVTARQDPSFQLSIALDLRYIEEWSLRLDLEILWRTIFVVAEGSGW